MNWGLEDLLAAIALAIGAGIGVAVALRFPRRRGVRLALAGGVLLTALVIWAHLAVGIF